MPDIKTFFKKVEVPNSETVTIPKTNIAEDLKEDLLLKIGREVCEGYTEDETTMTDWKDGVVRGLSLVELEESTKDKPFPRAANYKSPTLMSAALKWSDRAATELLRGDELAKPKTIGNDPDGLKADRGSRVAEYMNYQLNIEMEEWREEQDKLLYDIPYTGTVFKKVSYDPALERNVSNLVVYPNFVVDNNVSSMERLPRFSEEFVLSQNDIKERQLQGIWLDVDLKNEAGDELDGNQDFIEQLGWHDIDDDGLKEPYVFVVHKDTQKVVRMLPRFDIDQIIEKGGKIIRVEPQKSLVKYGFLRDPQGGFLDVGYGHLLASMTEVVNTTANQLIDAGKFSNLQGGFLAKNFRKNKGQLRAAPGQWLKTDMSAIDLQQSVLPHQYKEPSPTLFSLMQFILAGSQELSSSADLSNALGANAPATTTLAMVQEQQLSAGAIILRIYRSMTTEFGLLYTLTRSFGDPEDYKNVVDDEDANFEQDFDEERSDLIPVANPEVSSKIQRIQQATAELQTLEAVTLAGGDIRPIVKNFYEALGSQNIDEIFPELTPDQRLVKLLQENPELAEMIMGEKERADLMAATQIESIDREEERKDVGVELQVQEQERKNEETDASIILDLEKAETESAKNDVDTYTKLREAEINERDNQSGTGTVESQSSNKAII